MTPSLIVCVIPLNCTLVALASSPSPLRAPARVVPLNKATFWKASWKALFTCRPHATLNYSSNSTALQGLLDEHVHGGLPVPFAGLWQGRSCTCSLGRAPAGSLGCSPSRSHGSRWDALWVQGVRNGILSGLCSRWLSGMFIHHPVAVGLTWMPSGSRAFTMGFSLGRAPCSLGRTPPHGSRLLTSPSSSPRAKTRAKTADVTELLNVTEFLPTGQDHIAIPHSHKLHRFRTVHSTDNNPQALQVSHRSLDGQLLPMGSGTHGSLTPHNPSEWHTSSLLRAWNSIHDSP